jgi:hypothetical protein
MKKLLVLLVVAFSATTVRAQDESAAASHPASHECYTMKGHALMHCMGTKMEAVDQDVELENGMVIQTDGQILSSDGAEGTALEEGKCIDAKGRMMACDEMHAGMKKETPAEE